MKAPPYVRFRFYVDQMQCSMIHARRSLRLPPARNRGKGGAFAQAAIRAATGWRWCSQSAAFWAWAAAVKIARLSPFSTFNQLAT